MTSPPTGRSARRRRAASVVAVVLLSVVLGTPSPVSAETSITVGTPAGNLYQQGRPVPIVVTVSADSLLQAELVVRFADGAGGTVRRPVEVPGGSTKRFVVVADSAPWGGAPTVTLADDGGEVLARGGGLRPIHDEEPVGVLPSLAARGLPERVPLNIDAGEAVLFALDPTLLAEGSGVLTPFTHLLATEADLEALEPAALDAVLSWLDQGGRLLVDSGPVPAVITSRVGGQGDVVPVGLGEVVTTDGALGDGALDGLFRPTWIRSPGELPWGQGGFPTAPQLAADAGVTTPRVVGLLAVVGGYLVLVGPVLWLVLHRRRRELLLWLVVPAVAGLATAVVWVAGQRVRSAASGAHATLVVHGEGTSNLFTDVLLTSPNGGSAAIDLPAGWQLASHRGEDFGGQFPDAVLMGDRAEADVPPGGFALFRAVGPAAPSDELDLTAEADGSGVTGTVANRTDHVLSGVVIFSGGAHHLIPELAPGQRVAYRLGDAAASLAMEQPVTMELSSRGDLVVEGSAVSLGALSRWYADQGMAAATPGTVWAVGWTRDAPPPLEAASGEITAGRTGFVVRRRVVTGGSIGASAVRTEVVRGPSATRLGGHGRDGLNEVALTVAQTVPHRPEDVPMLMEVPSRVNALEVWVTGRWVPVELDGGHLVELPPGAFDAGVVYSRLGLGPDFWGATVPHPLIRSAEPGDRPVALLAPSGSGDV